MLISNWSKEMADRTSISSKSSGLALTGTQIRDKIKGFLTGRGRETEHNKEIVRYHDQEFKASGPITAGALRGKSAAVKLMQQYVDGNEQLDPRRKLLLKSVYVPDGQKQLSVSALRRLENRIGD